MFRAAGVEDSVRRASEEQYDSDGGISAVESLAGSEIAQYIPSLNAGVELVSPTRRLFLTQDALEPILRSRALELGAELRYFTELTDFAEVSDGVLATTRNVQTGAERSVHARYMVACDGWRSPVRERLGIGMAGHGLISNSITIYFRADCAPFKRGRTEGVLYVFNDSLSGFFRLDRDWKSGFLVVNTAGDTATPEATNVSEWIDDERAAELLRAAIGQADIAVEVVDIARWKEIADAATSFQHGRISIAGDAAHTVPPNGGFGGNTGVQDAFNLAWKIAHVLDGPAHPALIATYDAERRPVGALTIEQAYSRYVPRTAPYLGTDHIQPLVADLSLEIGHRYRMAAVIAEEGADDGLPYVDPRESRGLPGTRAPHLWLERDGDRVSSLDLFGRRFVLLAAAEGPLVVRRRKRRRLAGRPDARDPRDRHRRRSCGPGQRLPGGVWDLSDRGRDRASRWLCRLARAQRRRRIREVRAWGTRRAAWPRRAGAGDLTNSAARARPPPPSAATALGWRDMAVCKTAETAVP